LNSSVRSSSQLREIGVMVLSRLMTTGPAICYILSETGRRMESIRD
jgi:hypothetical protein